MFAKQRVSVLLISSLYLVCGDILVDLPKGTIRGRQAYTTTDNPFYAFQKVPYAKPPLDNLRFQAPVPPDNWDGILNTTENVITCFQLSWDTDQETEDCLYLNVYTPRLPSDGGDDELLPVMLWIHGGAFEEGDSLFTNVGPEFMIDQDIIVVTINYRLGVFGFLSTQDLVIPGNAGLKDMQMAIRWAHENIHLFGGDPDKLVVSGESAGGGAVAYQLLDDSAEGLFRGAIIESGTFLSTWAYQRNARDFGFQTARLIDENFSSEESEDLLEFMQSAAARDLDLAQRNVVGQYQTPRNRQLYQGFVYAPVIEPEHDGAFITEKMYVKFKSGNYNKVPAFMVVNSEECLFEAGDVNSLSENLKSYDDNLAFLVPDDMQITNETERAEVGRRIREIYTGGETFQDNLPKGVQYFTEAAFVRSMIKHAEIQSESTDVYFFQFSYDGMMGNNSISIEGADRVSHGEEIRYLWRTYFPGYDNSNMADFPESDVITHYRIIELWSNFVKYLNPTPEPSDLLQNVIWPTVNSGGAGNFLYLDLGEDLEIRNHPKGDHYPGWIEIYDSLGIDDFDTY